VRHPGVYEVPLGTTATELIALARRPAPRPCAQSLRTGWSLVGVFTGQHGQILHWNFRALAAVGSMLGSGAVVAIAEGTCMLELALNVGRFFRKRILRQVRALPGRFGKDRHAAGRHLAWARSAADLALIEALSEYDGAESICGLGQAAPNPILSVVKYFKDDITRYIARVATPWGRSAEAARAASAATIIRHQGGWR